jgi:hypothetical protein
LGAEQPIEQLLDGVDALRQEGAQHSAELWSGDVAQIFPPSCR